MKIYDLVDRKIRRTLDPSEIPGVKGMVFHVIDGRIWVLFLSSLLPLDSLIHEKGMPKVIAKYEVQRHPTVS